MTVPNGQHVVVSGIRVGNGVSGRRACTADGIARVVLVIWDALRWRGKATAIKRTPVSGQRHQHAVQTGVTIGVVGVATAARIAAAVLVEKAI